MIISALAFLSGILLVQQFSVLPGVAGLFALLIVAVCLGWRHYWRLMMLVLGIIWAIVVADIRLADRLSEHLAGKAVPISGVVNNLPELHDEQTSFDFLIENTKDPLLKKIKLTWYHPSQSIKAGQHWSLTVKLKPPHGSLNPGGFDYERWLFTEAVGATGYVKDEPQPVLLGQDSCWRSMTVCRQLISDQLEATITDSGLLRALTIGDGNGITASQWDIFRKTGTTHLVVISGSHIGLVAGLVYFCVLKLWAWTGWLRWSPQRIAAIAAIVAGIFYAGLAGFSVPAQRAVVMLIVIMVAIIQQRCVRPYNTLAVALMAVLLFDPLAVLSPGFWLSFLAVAVIIYAVAGRLGKSAYFIEACKINWVTSIGLSPLLLWFFQQVSLCSPLANLIAVPVIGLLVVPLALLAVVMMFLIPQLAKLLFLLLQGMLSVLIEILEKLAQWPSAVFIHPQPSYLALLLALPGLVLLMAPRGMPSRWLGMVLLLPMVFNEPEKMPTGAMKLTLLDVGQGLSVSVQTRDHWLIYDTGPKFSDESDSGSMVLVPYLREQGVSHLDSVIISHGDNDHIGGTVSLLHAIQTSQLLTSVPELLAEFAPQKCQAGQSWIWDEVKFTVLAPSESLFASENNNSCVLKITNQQGSVLLTGDIEAQAESWLVQQYGEALKAELLIAPHHGSKTSSTMSFLDTVKPVDVFIPAGYRNRFGHPHRSVLARYHDINAHWFNTADSGAIIASFKNPVMSVATWRDINGKYWNYRAPWLK